jgi:hypothetical protein
MNILKHFTVSSLTTVFIVSSSILVLQSPVHAGFWDNARRSIKKEVNNCVSGGCDPTRTNPKEVLRTTTGARAIGAATDRWLNRQIRINTAKANDLKNRLRQNINENFKCLEFPTMEGVCTELNQYHGLNMQIQRFSWKQFADLYPSNVQFARNCIDQKNIVFGKPSTLRCLPFSQYPE